MKTFDKPILIQWKDQKARQWVTFQRLHAHINTTSSSEYTTAGSTRSFHSLTFTVRYNPELKKVGYAMQDYRIAWDGAFYRITSYDDYNLQHVTVKLVGSCSGAGELDE